MFENNRDNGLFYDSFLKCDELKEAFKMVPKRNTSGGLTKSLAFSRKARPIIPSILASLNIRVFSSTTWPKTMSGIARSEPASPS